MPMKITCACAKKMTMPISLSDDEQQTDTAIAMNYEVFFDIPESPKCNSDAWPSVKTVTKCTSIEKATC